jgi:hypothetical protein
MTAIPKVGYLKRITYLLDPQRPHFERLTDQLRALTAGYGIRFAAGSAGGEWTPKLLEKKLQAALRHVYVTDCRTNAHDPQKIINAVETLARLLAAEPLPALRGKSVDLIHLTAIYCRAIQYVPAAEKAAVAKLALKGFLHLSVLDPSPRRAKLEAELINNRNVSLAQDYLDSLNKGECWGVDAEIAKAHRRGEIFAKRILLHELAEIAAKNEFWALERSELFQLFPEITAPFRGQMDLTVIIDQHLGTGQQRHELLLTLHDHYPQAHQQAVEREAEYLKLLAEEFGLPAARGGEFFAILELFQQRHLPTDPNSFYDADARY